jgi:hypothetical protein
MNTTGRSTPTPASATAAQACPRHNLTQPHAALDTSSCCPSSPFPTPSPTPFPHSKRSAHRQPPPPPPQLLFHIDFPPKTPSNHPPQTPRPTPPPPHPTPPHPAHNTRNTTPPCSPLHALAARSCRRSTPASSSRSRGGCGWLPANRFPLYSTDSRRRGTPKSRASQSTGHTRAVR